MSRDQSEGTCRLCGSAYTKSGMTRHLRACLEKNAHQLQSGDENGSLQEVFHLYVQPPWPKPLHWLHLATPAAATFAELDQFLRDIWLECCGHLSAFEVMGQRLDAHPFEYSDGDMDHPLGEWISGETEFDYQYDFGSTTPLHVQVATVLDLRSPQEDVQILARNEPPEFSCDLCEGEAALICPICVYEDEGLLCEEHAASHACGEEMLLPLVNSPRAGVCAYTGSRGIDW